MRCPFCGCEEDKVVDSRATKEGRAIRRRRECLACSRRYTTYEEIETVLIQVVKSDGRKEPFNRSKLITGLYMACKKRPVSTNKINDMVESIEENLYKLGKEIIPSRTVGEFVMKALQEVDEVAYMRFASVYRNFNEVSEFLHEINGLHNQQV